MVPHGSKTKKKKKVCAGKNYKWIWMVLKTVVETNKHSCIQGYRHGDGGGNEIFDAPDNRHYILKAIVMESLISYMYDWVAEQK